MEKKKEVQESPAPKGKLSRTYSSHIPHSLRHSYMGTFIDRKLLFLYFYLFIHFSDFFCL